jgi:hypothetical protein
VFTSHINLAVVYRIRHYSCHRYRNTMPAGKRVEPHEAAMIRRYLEETSLSTQAIANKMPPLSKRTID